jgi:energy-coupling factor transport system substrate-specific component
LSWPFALFGAVALVLGIGWLAYERARPSARMAAVVGTLAAVAALGRDAFVALPEVKPITAITFVVGYSLGPLPGFTVGAVGMLASNILLGQGPYTPWQMAAWGLVGLAGALLGRLSRRRLGRVGLALGCAVSAGVAKEIMDVYTWTIGANHTPAAFLAVAGTALPFDLVDIVASFGFGLAFAPELARLLGRTRARMTVSWEPATGETMRAATTLLLALVLVVYVLSAAGGGSARAAGLDPVPPASSVTSAARVSHPPVVASAARLDIARELSFLAGAQNADGGFGGARGQSSNELDSAWVAMGLAAAGRDPLSVRRAGHTVVDSIRGEAATLQGAGDLERTILGLHASGVAADSLPGVDLLGKLLSDRAADGSFEHLVNITSFAVFALRAAGRSAHDPLVKAAGRWIAAQENHDGGFGFSGHSASGAGGASDVDDTAAALQALIDAGVRSGPTVKHALAFLIAAQNPDGGYPQERGGESNAQSTSWAVQGLIAAGRNPGAIRRHGSRSPVAYLETLLAPNGSVRYSRTSAQTPVWVTAQALTALAGVTFPVAPVRVRARVGSSAAVNRRLYPVGTMPSNTPNQPISWALRVAALCLLGMIGTWIVVVSIPAVRVHDASLLADLTRLDRPRLDGVGNRLLDLLNPFPFVIWGAALVAVAFVRRRPRVALAVALVLGLAPLTAELLKPLLAYPHVQAGWKLITAASWPSGHTTAATTLALCAVLVSPRVLRPSVAVLGVAFSLAVGVLLLVLAWHMPSDVLGGYLLATFWVSLAVAALGFCEQRWPSRSRHINGASDSARAATRSNGAFSARQV